MKRGVDDLRLLEESFVIEIKLEREENQEIFNSAVVVMVTWLSGCARQEDL